MANIERATVHLVHRATTATLATSYGPPPVSRDHLVVTLQDETGRVGWGEASPLPFFTGETPQGLRANLENHYLPMLIGREATEIGVLHVDLERGLPGNSSARAAIDMALHDLSGQTLGVPVATLLGGVRRGRVPVSRPIGITSIDEAVSIAVSHVAAGHRTLKLKVGVDSRADVERVRAIREAVGPGVKLRVDANQGYDYSAAVWMLRSLESVELEYIEQPLPKWAIADLVRLRSKVATRIAVDEGLHHICDAVELIRRGAVDVFVIKLIKTGGLLPAKRITDLGEAYGVATTVVSPFDTQIGAAHGLHLALTLPEEGPACELTVFSAQQELAHTGHVVKDGNLIPALGAGVGVERIAELDRVA